MRPTFEQRPNAPGESFRCFADEVPSFPFFWHYQNDYELVLITKGRGTRFIGDSIAPFEAGDLVLVGPGLPHTWVSSTDPASADELSATVYVQFCEDFLGPDFFSAPELEKVRRLLSRSGQGIGIGEPARTEAAAGMLRLPSVSGLARLTQLLQVLDCVARSPDLEELASGVYGASRPTSRQQRIESACEFIHEHYRDPIGLSEVAGHVHMSASAFARAFKRATMRTVSRYVNELRVGHACSLLMSGDQPVTGVAHESGFRSLPYFNRTFRDIKGASPREFRRSMLQQGMSGPRVSRRP